MIKPIGHFRVWRELYTKPIWLNSTLEQQVILMTLMAMANWKENQWEWEGSKYDLKPGQFITSTKSIIENSGNNVTTQNVRTALKRFEKLEFLTNQSTKRGRLITLVNWQDYQYIEEKGNRATSRHLTESQPTPNRELTTIEEGNKERRKESNNKHTEIFNHWITKNIIQHSKITENMEKAMDKALKNYSLEVIKESISVYAEAYHSDYFYQYKHSLEDFLKQKNGLPDWIKEGSKYENYMEYKKKNNRTTDNTDKYKEIPDNNPFLNKKVK